jgi:hypothetical protein
MMYYHYTRNKSTRGTKLLSLARSEEIQTILKDVQAFILFMAEEQQLLNKVMGILFHIARLKDTIRYICIEKI